MKLKQFVKDSGGVTKDYHQIDPRELQIRPDFNIRDLTTPVAREKLDILKAQIKAEGVLEPLEIEFDGNTPWINEGHRRLLVVMELIAEGQDFKTIPCVQERQGTDPAKRNLHMLMRKKEDYEPLEYAAGVARQINVYGWDKADLARDLGFESKASIDRYLEMLGMTDEVKEQVATGVASATLALKVTRDTRDAKTDPKFAAEILAAAAAEQKALGKKGRATPKAVKRLSEYAKPKPKSDPKLAPFVAEVEDADTTIISAEQRAAIEAAAAAMQAQPASGLPETTENEGATPAETPPWSAPASMIEPIQRAMEGTKPAEVHEQLQTAAQRERPIASARDIDRAMFAIIQELYEISEGNDLNAFADTDMIEVPAAIFKRADRIYRERIGDTSEAA